MNKFIGLAFLLLLGASQSFSQSQNSPEPFGFHYGSSKADVIKQLGNSAVTKVSQDGVAVTFKTAPKPHPDFEAYTLFFSPTQGLLKVIAVGKDIETGDDGAELRKAYGGLKSGLEAKYGQPQDLDNCKEEGVACEARFFMMELKQNNRNLFSIWQAEKTGIILEAKALGINKGYLVLSYEFQGWNEFVDNLNKKKDSVL